MLHNFQRLPRRSRAGLVAVPVALAMQVVVPAFACAATLQFNDPGFEAGSSRGCSGSWGVSGAGCATNNTHSGVYAAYLNGSDGNSISQTITSPVDGTFDFSAWISVATVGSDGSTAGSGGTFSIQVGNNSAQTITIPSAVSTTNYIKYTLPRLAVKTGDSVRIGFNSSSGRQWINIDDIEIVPSAPNDPQISSDGSTDGNTLVAMFNWAKVKANSWVRYTGATGVINMDENNKSGTTTATYASSYWAGYPFRSDFYSRDFAHQFVGAHILGLDEQNKAMLNAFAGSVKADGYPVWSLNFDGATPGSIDYTSDSSFVRELPAPFELAQRVSDGYKWTGDAGYTDKNGKLYPFVRNTVSTFVSNHYGTLKDGTANGRQVNIAQESGSDIFKGVASYNEGTGGSPVEAADVLSSQYQAYLAMAALATANGDPTTASDYAQKAGDLQTYYNAGTWSGLDSSTSSANSTNVIRSYDSKAASSTAWGAEMSWFPPMKGIMKAGTPRNDYMSWLNTTALKAGSTPPNLEAITYLPDAFFAVHDGTTGWAWMQYIYNRINSVHGGYGANFVNGDYPEVSFTLIGQVVQGLLGVQPEAADNKITTASQLPSSIGWLQVTSIPVGNGKITLRHDGATKSTLSNTSSSGGPTYSWHARFPGTYRSIVVNGANQALKTEQPEGSNGPAYTYADVSVAPGSSAVVQVSP
ncbi:hypothetical protein [Burkholderia sp. NLJ2]|uniref:hypothetical protein n=1 Tax=Burkholderia sp. NLJ2 TaxID=3090699 RepID=UPI003C6C853B